MERNGGKDIFETVGTFCEGVLFSGNSGRYWAVTIRPKIPEISMGKWYRLFLVWKTTIARLE